MRKPVPACLGFVVLFWVLVEVAATRNPGYVHYRFQISTLAAPGAHSPWLAQCAIACVAAAHLVTAPALARWHGLVGALVAAAGALLIPVALFRAPCPYRASFCARGAATGVSEYVHTVGVLGSALCVMTAMLVAGVHRLRAGRKPLAGAPGMAAATLIGVALLGGLQSPAGSTQRMWILVGQLWLIGMAMEAAPQMHRRQPSPLDIRLAIPEQ